ncbi:LOW QUALITY PROTEIN: pentatricopeptide repeat-containing protein At2g29760, chloroplastic-like [Dioscorea cayenensis subsp. rotundata]|uniref:LOW QUALITY PROTEIN: pentatricopeptide repeat-containing protein At2g29760, chloroplastic-like n=1 Tax=Dioscorea cayennensis subsp. rotundata TaxID=55577 RepID=A0AB40CWA6_DIOCR|nr:LOW QUALITY PROTEIN: pentatricopeptide repeat-containing protein At2g29760, chloroplastic-like [Dioscorea cayenensis subsp. rotundata]
MHPFQVSSLPTTGTTSHGFREHPALALLDGYKSIDAARIKQIHAPMLRLSLFSDFHSATRLLTAYSLSPHPNLVYARRVFDQIPQPNLYSWNTLIRAYASSSDPLVALLLLSQMLHCSCFTPDKFTFPFAIKAAAGLSALKVGSALHAMAVKSPFHSDVFVLNSLIHFYAACGELELSYQVFEKTPQKDVVSWNSIIAAFSRAGRCDEALELFSKMECGDLRPNDVTMVSVLSACGKKEDLELGKWIHSYIEMNDIPKDLILINAILDMYVKCGSIEDAKQLFDKMTERDSVSWTTMLAGYAKAGELDAARRVFDSMPQHDIASWNALISGYEQNGQPKEALALFNESQLSDVRPDQVTLVATLSACSQLGALELGCWIHAYMEKNNFNLNFHLTTSLIDMYSKCGDLEKALHVFKSVEKKDVFVWSAMIAGLAMHGKGKAALDLFSQMQDAQIPPNHVTFTNILRACSHAGLVYQGRLFFSQMQPIYGIEPRVEHYGCMVDILGRAGLLEEAEEFIEKMPIQSGASTWGALLAACVLHKNVDLGEYACKRLLELEPGNDGAYVLLSNLYAKTRKWDGVARLRKQMKDTGIKKEPGCSLVEVNGVVHEFLVGDTAHAQSEKIYLKLDEITSKLKEVGYTPDSAQVLQDIEEEEKGTKERALYLHSEKLTIAYGLISIKSPAPIRIAKNLRICDDCHSAAKLISSVYNRQIYLRDRYRFHHFKDGSCSCMDYW